MAGIFIAGGVAWHETLPFLVGIIFVAVEICVRLVRRKRPILHVPALAFVLSEGISLFITPVYAFALIFNPPLASDIAAKNGKVLAVAMFVAFFTLLMHLIERWRTGRKGI